MRDSIAPARTHAIKAELEVSYGDEEDNFLQSDNDHEVDEPPAKKRGEVKSTEDNSKKTLDIDASVGQLLERSNTSSNEEKWDPKEGKSAVLSSLKLDLQKDETGPYVDTELASIAKTLIKDGLPEEKLQDKMSKYHRPGNCENLTKVRVNQAVWDNLSPSVRSHDVKMQKVQTSLFKVPLRRKFCIPFSLQLLKVEVITTYHAKFYIEIPTGRPVILIVKFSFVLPPLLDSKNGLKHIESWI